MRRVKPAVDEIKKAGVIEEQAAALCVVVGHRDLADARTFAGINSLTDASAAMYLCGQSARMIGRARSNEKLRGKTSRDKQDAVETVLTTMAPSPNRTFADVPSMRKRAKLMGVRAHSIELINV